MNILRTTLHELIGMFIDDGALALLSIILIAIITVAVELAGLSGLSGGVLLLVGCILILAESTSRAAKKIEGTPNRPSGISDSSRPRS